MRHTRLGATGVQVSRLCLGMMGMGAPQWRPWVLGEDDARPIFRRAVELGVNFIDTADTYSAGESEKLVGKLVRELGRRDEMVITTKVYNPVTFEFKSGQDLASLERARRPNMQGLSRKRIFAAIDASLQRLQMDYVDLYQIHRWDYAVPVEEFMEALHDVVKAGKARYIGASSMWAWQFAKAQHVAERHAWTKFVSMQNHYNLAYREEEREMLPMLRDMGVGCIPWSPLARGFLAGNRRAVGEGDTARAKGDAFAHTLYFADSDFQVVDRVVALAQARGVKPAQIALAWLLHQPGVTAPIVGTTKVEQLDQAIAALDIILTPEELAQLEELYQPHTVRW